MEGLAKMGAVNCDEDVNKPLCSKFGVQGFPTIKVIPWNAKHAAQAQDYQGARSAGSIAKHLLEQLPNLVTSVKDAAAWTKFVGKAGATELKKVLLFSDKSEVSTLYKALATQFNGRLAFAQAASKGALAEQFGVTEAPTLLVLGADGGGEPAKFEGKLKPLTVGKFLAGFAPKPKNEKAAPEPEKKAAADEPPRRNEQDALWRLASPADYKARCQDRPGNCVIGILDPQGDEHAAHLAALEGALAKHKGGPFTFVWLDGFAQERVLKTIGLFGADLPQIYLVNDGKRAAGRYIGAFEAAALSSFVERVQTGSAKVTKLADKVDIQAAFVDEAANSSNGSSAGSSTSSDKTEL